jgi:solute carrier family 25 (peroxisomal adenine nucleotide transporter), member 17
MAPASDDPFAPKQAAIKKLSFLETAQKIINKDGLGGLWAGIGPALTLVINPIIQVREFLY